MRRLYDGKIMHGKRRSLTDLLWRRTPNRTSAGQTSTLVEERVVRPAVSGSVLAGLASAVGVAIILKIVLLSAGVIPFNADEAVVALMARHITMGARPLFFYGQAYMGSLDAFLRRAGVLGFWPTYLGDPLGSNQPVRRNVGNDRVLR